MMMIEAKDLRFTFPGAAGPAVRGIGFRVEAGEVFGFLGPSGSGKSTTQNVLIGLLEGYEGTVRVLGRDRSAWRADDYERIGVAFETPNHFSKLTGAENLRYFAALYARETRHVEEALESVGLGAEGGKRAGEYSKGMKKRLSVARAMLHRPELLFLDEPTSGLDPANVQGVKDLIRSERERGATVFLATHDMSVADDLCDRVAFIVDGRIALIGAPRALKLEHGERTVRVERKVNGALRAEGFPLDGLGSNEAFLELLRSGGIETMHTREASLADVFIKVTGRALR